MKKTLQEMFGAYFVEVEWIHQNYVPPVEEYMKNGVVSIGCFACTTATFLGVDEDIASVNMFEWIISQPKILRAGYEIARLKNGISSHMREKIGILYFAVWNVSRKKV